MNVPCLRVLLVEDDDANVALWQGSEKGHNADAEAKGFSVHTSVAKTASHARELLESTRFDAAVVDLRLLPDNGEMQPNDNGNELIRSIVQQHPVAIAIYSGQTQEADRTTCQQVEVFDRAGGLAPVFEWLAKQRNMLEHLRGTRLAMERETARVFFSSIWPRWNRWTTSKDAGGQLTQTLARHVVAHVHDSLLDASGGAAHPDETYFYPALKTRLDTGDMLQDKEGAWIVVTPRCDLANPGKTATILIAKCEDIAARWADSTQKTKEKLVQHDGAAKQHFLPPLYEASGKQMGPWMVQFHHLRAVPHAESATLLERRIASLSPQFVPSLVERFGAYFSRIGTPNLVSEQ